MIMDRLYGGVCYAGIDTDPELKYPKGAGRVAFSNQQSYIAAISARFVQLQHGEIDKRVRVTEKEHLKVSACPSGLLLSRTTPQFSVSAPPYLNRCLHVGKLLLSRQRFKTTSITFRCAAVIEWCKCLLNIRGSCLCVFHLLQFKTLLS